jgi:hypothetical protein
VVFAFLLFNVKVKMDTIMHGRKIDDGKWPSENELIFLGHISPSDMLLSPPLHLFFSVELEQLLHPNENKTIA